MADPEDITDLTQENGADTEMDNGDENVETLAPGAEDGDGDLTGLENIEPDVPEKIGFLE